MALIFYEFSHNLNGLLDFLGVGLPLNFLTLIVSHGYVILSLLERIRPQILKVVIIKVWFEIRNIEVTRDSILPREINLICIVIDLL